MTTATVEQPVTITTAAGHVARFAVRADTNDSALVAGIIGESEYPFDRLQGLTGWAIDIGAHIGIVTVALALDNPGLRIVAVEALPENADMLIRNAVLNGLRDVRVVYAAAGSDEPTNISWDYEYVPDETDEANKPGGYVHASRYIGNIYGPRQGMVSKTRVVPGISLAKLLDRFGISNVAFLKLDCEGCEWTVLRDPAIAHCQRIIGEWHGDPGLPGLQLLLEETHNVRQIGGNPTNGIFEAVRR